MVRVDLSDGRNVDKFHLMDSGGDSVAQWTSHNDHSDCVTLTQNNVGKLVCGQMSNQQLEWTKVDKFHDLVVAEGGQVPRKGKI